MATTNFDLPVTFNQSEDYDLFAHEAHRLVDELVQQSLTHVNDTTDDRRDRYIVSENGANTSEQPAVHWPTIAEFSNEKIGINKINEYIEKEWKITAGGHDNCWVYAIDFLERKTFEFNDLYIYRVRYSIPVRRQPIPRRTVSIYFTIDVSKIHSENTPVKVSFIFETMRVIHHPQRFRFRQHWLENILLLKEKSTNGIDF